MVESAYFFPPNAWIYDSLLVFYFFLSSLKLNITLPVFLVSLATADLPKALLISLASFAVTAIIFFWVFSQKLGFGIKLHEFLTYYFFHSFVSVAIMVIGHVQVLFFKKSVALDRVT